MPMPVTPALVYGEYADAEEDSSRINLFGTGLKATTLASYQNMEDSFMNKF